MRATRHVLLFGVCCWMIFTAACAPPQPPEPPDTRAADEAAIREADTAWSKAAETKQIDAAVSYYAEDAVILPPNGPMASGPEARRKFWSDISAMPGFSIKWQPTQVEAARSGDIGYSRGTYELTMNDPKGTPMTDRGKYVVVWKKQADGSWKAAVDTFNSDLPPAPPATR